MANLFESLSYGIPGIAQGFLTGEELKQKKAKTEVDKLKATTDLLKTQHEIEKEKKAMAAQEQMEAVKRDLLGKFTKAWFGEKGAVAPESFLGGPGGESQAASLPPGPIQGYTQAPNLREALGYGMQYGMATGKPMSLGREEFEAMGLLQPKQTGAEASEIQVPAMKAELWPFLIIAGKEKGITLQPGESGSKLLTPEILQRAQELHVEQEKKLRIPVGEESVIFRDFAETLDKLGVKGQERVNAELNFRAGRRAYEAQLQAFYSRLSPTMPAPFRLEDFIPNVGKGQAMPTVQAPVEPTPTLRPGAQAPVAAPTVAAAPPVQPRADLSIPKLPTPPAGEAPIQRSTRMETEAREQEQLKWVRLPADLNSKRALYNQVINDLDGIESVFDPNFIGKGFQAAGGFKDMRKYFADAAAAMPNGSKNLMPGNIAGSIRQWVGSASPAEVEFRQRVADIANTILYARSGAQINESEFRRLQGALFSMWDEPTVFLTRLKTTRSLVESLVKDLVEGAATPAKDLIRQPSKKPSAPQPKENLRGKYGY